MMRPATAEEFALLERAKSALPESRALATLGKPSSLFSLTDGERAALGCMIESYGPAEVLAQFVSIASEKANRVRLHFPHQAQAWDETAIRLAAIVPGICARLG